MPLSDNIKRFRELKGLTVQELADKMGIGKAGIYKWESGETKPGIDSLTDLSKALDVSIGELTGENPTSVDKASDNKQNGIGPRETFYQDLMEKNEQYSVIPTAVLKDYKIVPDKIIDVIIKSGENERNALQKSMHLEIESLNEKNKSIIESYKNGIKILEAENERLKTENELLRRQIPPPKNQN
jgi:transcriptional regulator with XRE-family HTH domain